MAKSVQARDGQTADLAAAAAELYSVLPAEFTAARNERAKAARQGGHAELADRIRALPKPSTAAWVVNMMVSHRRDEIEQFLQVGASLRAAQEQLDPGELRVLNRRRHLLLQALVRESRAVAGKLGHKVSDSVATEVEKTLRTAMGRPGAAAAVRTGQRTRALADEVTADRDWGAAVAVPAALHDADLDGADLDGAAGGSAGDAARARTRARRQRPEPERLEEDRQRTKVLAEVQQAASEAGSAVRKAEGGLQDVETRITELAARRGKLEAGLRDLKNRISEVEQDIASAQWEARGLDRDRDKAVRAAEGARRKWKRAREQLDAIQRKARD